MAEVSRTTDRPGGLPPQRLSIVAFFANNPVAANLLMLLLIIGGAMIARQLNTELFPTLDPGIINVSVPYPGATPAEVAESITQRVDEAVRSIDGVKRVVSRASEGYGLITVELKEFTDSETIRDDVQAAIDLLADFPPADAEEPEVVVFEPLQPVMTLLATTPGDEAYLDFATHELEEALRDLPSVSHVEVEGIRNYEISIEVSETALRTYGLTFDELARAIRQSSLNLSSGEIRSVSGDLLLRTDQKRNSGKEFEDIVVRTLPGGAVVSLGDIATITDGYTDDELEIESNGQRAALIRIQKSEDQNVLDISNEVLEFLETYVVPTDVSVEIWSNESDYLRERLGLLLRNGALGFALMFTFLVLMLDLRLAFWVAMGIPISFFGAFLFLDFFGVTLNMISMFALIIVLGIVVDDAIVVGENIGSEQQRGLRGAQAAIAGVKGVFSPVFVGVLTTMAAFAPLMFLTGTFGQILSVLPIVVITVLAISLVEVFFILPAHLSHTRRWSAHPLDTIQDFISSKIQWFRDNIVTAAVRLVVRHRYISMVWGFGFLGVAMALIVNGAVRIEFFPQIETDQVEIHVDFPVGTPFDVTENAIRRIEDAVHKVNDSVGGTAIRAVTMTAGARVTEGDGPGGAASMNFARNIASISLQLNNEPLRTVSGEELTRRIRRTVGPIPGAESVNYVSDRLAESVTLQYELIHEDDDKLRLAVEEMNASLAEFPMITEIRDSLSDGKRQFDISLTEAGIAAGLTQAVVARQLRQSFFGEEIQRIQRGRDEIKVMLRYPAEARRSTSNFFNSRIRLSDGTELPLTTVAKVTESRSFSAIDRIDGVRVATISAEVDRQYMSTGDAAKTVGREILPELKSRFPRLEINTAGFSRDQTEDFASLQALAIVALIVIYTMIAGLMRSYVMPLVVLSGVPFGAAGAVIGHYLLGFDVSMISMFGIVALSGVVVNDSLVLIDRYRRLRIEDSELSVLDAIVEAARLRFRAIFLTTVTTALGLTPMLFETSIQARFLVPMAVSLATGIIFASFVILFLVPALVVIKNDLTQIAKRLIPRQHKLVQEEA
ncbi:MAG: efflux RND transporter permease subunit [Gammaproteobacteria bacterium]|nr:efflux RND transporter permease subunit [Gammaproteobacteria bacterium]